MSVTLTLNDVPQALFDQLQLKGKAMNRSAEAEALEFLVSQLMPTPRIDPKEFAREIRESHRRFNTRPIDPEQVIADIRRMRG